MDFRDAKIRVVQRALLCPPPNPYKRPSNEMSDIEIEAKRLRSEAVNPGTSNQTMEITGSSSDSLSDSIAGFGDLAALSKALQDQDEAELMRLASKPSVGDDFKGHVLGLFFFMLGFLYIFADYRASSSSPPVATSTSARSTKTTLPTDLISPASIPRYNTTNMRWT
jgi:hypothetical protein